MILTLHQGYISGLIDLSELRTQLVLKMGEKCCFRSHIIQQEKLDTDAYCCWESSGHRSGEEPGMEFSGV